MSEELQMEQLATEDEIFSRPFCLDYYGKGVHLGVSVARPTDEFSGGVCLPHFLGVGESEIKKWYTESSYTSVELMLPEKEKIERLKKVADLEKTRIRDIIDELVTGYIKKYKLS